MGVTEQSIGRMLKALQEQGYVSRASHPTDRRRREVSLTNDGREVLRALDSAAAVESLIGDALTPHEIDQLRTLLIRLLAHAPPPTPPAP